MNDTMTMSEWDNRIQNAAQALCLTPVDLAKTLQDVMGIMKKPNGIETLDDDDVFKFGDFREVFKTMGIAPLRMAFKALKGGKKTEDRKKPDDRTAQLRELGFKVRLENADTQQLLSLYVPDKPSDPVTLALKTRFGARPVIAFKDDGKIAVDETLEYVSGLEQGYPEQGTLLVSGKLVKLWPVGVKPDVMVEEDPLFPGHPLRNGCSMVNNRNWTKVSLLNRQFCRVIVEHGDINPDNKEAVLRLLERAQGEKGYDALTDAYPEAELELRNRQIKSDLPKLVIPLGAALPASQNPFGVRRQY